MSSKNAVKEKNGVNPVPEGFGTLTPYLFVRGTGELIDFLKAAFGAEEIERHTGPDGQVMFAQLRIGGSMIMMSEPRDNWKPMPCGVFMYVEDTDVVYAKALAAGAVSLMEPADQFYGDRNAGVKDPFGNNWWIGTHVEDVSAEEMQRRLDTMGQ